MMFEWRRGYGRQLHLRQRLAPEYRLRELVARLALRRRKHLVHQNRHVRVSVDEIRILITTTLTLILQGFSMFYFVNLLKNKIIFNSSPICCVGSWIGTRLRINPFIKGLLPPHNFVTHYCH